MRCIRDIVILIRLLYFAGICLKHPLDFSTVRLGQFKKYLSLLGFVKSLYPVMKRINLIYGVIIKFG